MSREKQIEKMARTLCGEKEHDCDVCDSRDFCEFWYDASILHNAGYRKASEVAAEIFAEAEKIIDSLCRRHMMCGNPKQSWGVSSVAYEIAELKKKYTESEGAE